MDRDRPSPSWAVVATVKEPLLATKQFIAHYKSLGADEIHLFLDDPEDPAYEPVKDIEGVFVTRCTEAYWQGKKPPRQERRQNINARRAYADCGCDWIIHLDADEFLYCPNGVSQLLGKAETEDDAFQVRPAEPLIRPKTGEIVAYRSPLPANAKGKRIGNRAFGEIYSLLEGGLLSHAVGKFFLRTKLPGTPITIHRPQIKNKANIKILAKTDILLLHHHGASEDEWVKKFHLRMKTTYSAAFKDNKPKSGKIDGAGLNAYLQNTYAEKGEAGVRAFYRQVYHIGPEKQFLRRLECIHRPKIWLDQKTQDLFEGGTKYCQHFHTSPISGKLEATANLFDLSIAINPDFNYEEGMLALGVIEEAAELERIKSIVQDKTVTFWGFGANSGIYSLLTAKHADKDSKVFCFCSSPEEIKSIEKNASLNNLSNITCAGFPLENNKDPISGQASSQRNEFGNQPANEDTSALTVMKADISGAQAAIMARFFDSTIVEYYPDYILYKHTQTGAWDIPAEDVFPFDCYKVEKQFPANTLLKKVI